MGYVCARASSVAALTKRSLCANLGRQERDSTQKHKGDLVSGVG